VNIIVCVKEVPNPALPVEFDFVNYTVKDETWNYILNPCDEAALEKALLIKEQFSGEVTAITAGPPRSEPVLRKCLALGADVAIRVDTRGLPPSDSLATAKILYRAIKRLTYDIVLCGDQSMDRNCGETGAMLAELLGIPVVTSIVAMEIDNNTNTVTVSRKLERGAREIKRCRLPALFTTDLMLNEPRYPTLRGRKKAARQDIRIIALDDLLKDQGLMELPQPVTRVVSTTPPPPKKIFIPSGNLSPADRIRMLTQGVTAKKSSGNILEGAPGEIAKKVVAFLKEKRFLP